MIPLFKISWGQDDIDAISEAISSGMNWAIGDKVEEFEQAIADYIGTKYAVVFNSGTSALHALLMAFEIGPGDEVIVPSFTFPATSNCVFFVGAQPIFADIETRTYGLDGDDVEKKITDRTKAIIVVHYAGCPAYDTRRLVGIAKRHRLLLIEDAAEAFGASIGKKKVGTYGKAAMFSFCQNKIITTGDGGAITTNYKHIYERLKAIRSHGNDEQIGYNFRMPNLLAALGLSQIRKADELIASRRTNANFLINAGIGKRPPSSYHHVYQLFTFRTKRRDQLKMFLEENGIATKVYFPPVHLTKLYKKLGYQRGLLPVTERVSGQVLTLPIYPTLTKEELDKIKALCC